MKFTTLFALAFAALLGLPGYAHENSVQTTITITSPADAEKVAKWKTPEERRARRKERREKRNGPDTLVVTYNALTGVVSRNYDFKIKDNGTVVFEIEGINLLRYDVTINEIQNDIVSSEKLSEGAMQVNVDPSIFNVSASELEIEIIPVAMTSEGIQRLSLEEKKQRFMTSINRTKDAMDKNQKKIAQAEKNKNDRNYFKSEIYKQEALRAAIPANAENKAELERKSDSLIDDYTAQIKILNLHMDSVTAIKIITDGEDEKTKLDSTLLALQDSLVKVESQIDSYKNNQMAYSSRFGKFNKDLTSYKKSLAELNKMTLFYQRLLVCLYSDQSWEAIQNDKKRITAELFGNDNLRRDEILKLSHALLAAVDSNFLELSNAYSEIGEILLRKNDNNIKNTTLPESAELAKEMYNKIAAFNSQISKKPYYDFFMQIVKVYDAINESNFKVRHQTNIISDNADVITYSLRARPHANLPGSVETRAINYSYNVSIRGGIKIDVSSGLFWNLGIYDSTYRFESQSDSTTSVIGERNNNLFIPSVGLMFHMYRRSDNNIKFGGSFGVSTNAERLNYHVGGSVLIGKSERVNVNFGIIGAQVKRSTDKYRGGTILPVPVEDLPNEVPLQETSPFWIGGYVGITYNLNGSKNKEALTKVITQ